MIIISCVVYRFKFVSFNFVFVAVVVVVSILIMFIFCSLPCEPVATGFYLTFIKQEFSGKIL